MLIRWQWIFRNQSKTYGFPSSTLFGRESFQAEVWGPGGTGPSVNQLMPSLLGYLHSGKLT